MSAPELNAHALIIASTDIAARERFVAELVAGEGSTAGPVRKLHNVFWLEPDRSYSRAEIVRVLHELSMTSFSSEPRWVIFSDARLLTPEAANSLLKIIEEPPSDVRFALLVDTVAHVMSTLRSRAQLIALPPQKTATHVAAITWLASSIPARLAQIARLKDRTEQLRFYQELLEQARSSSDYGLADWLLGYADYAQRSGNLRLLLETCALRTEIQA